MSEVRYATREILEKLNDFAIENDFNRSVDPLFIELLPDDDTMYPVTFMMLHNESEIRTSFYVPDHSITIDLDPAAFLRLKKIEIDEEIDEEETR